MKISVIAAVAEGGVIGRGNFMPWKLSPDLRRFKKLTLGHPIIMGRKTYDSIGKPLPGRKNIVVTRQTELQIPGCKMANSLDAALRIAEELRADEVFVIGGGEIYRQAMTKADTLYLTEIFTRCEGDAFFPGFNNQWKEIERKENFPMDTGENFQFDFVVYQRTKK